MENKPVLKRCDEVCISKKCLRDRVQQMEILVSQTAEWNVSESTQEFNVRYFRLTTQ